MKTNEIFHKATYNKVKMVHCKFLGVTDYNLKKNCFSLKINFVMANSVDPDEMPPYAAFHLGLLNCLPLYLLRGFQSSKGSISGMMYEYV